MTEKKSSKTSHGPFGLTYGDIALLLALVLVLALGLIPTWLLLTRNKIGMPSTSTPTWLAPIEAASSQVAVADATPAPSQQATEAATSTSTQRPTDTPPKPTSSPTAAPSEPTSVPSREAVTATPAPTRSPSPTQVEDTPTPSQPVTATATPSPQPPTATPTPTWTPTSAPKPAPLTGVIVFPVFDKAAGTYSIYAAKPDGSERRLVVAEASQPTLNSSGDRIAYRSWAQNRGLIERAINGDADWRFNTFGEAARPAFAPDDQSFLFHSREGGEPPAIYHTFGLEYQVLRRGSDPIQGESPAWLPDGRFIYKGWLGSDEGLILSNLDGGFPALITDHKSDTNPSVSRDGESVAFMSDRRRNWDVYTVKLDGTGVTQLTTGPANDGLPTWSPDGKTIAFVSDRSGEWALWAMDNDGGNQRLLFELGGSIDGVVTVDVQNSYGWLEESIDWAP